MGLLMLRLHPCLPAIGLPAIGLPAIVYVFST